MTWVDFSAWDAVLLLAGWLGRHGYDLARRGALAYVDYRAARARHDHAETWEDTFWPRLREQLITIKPQGGRDG